jgi:hypothetical protein
MAVINLNPQQLALLTWAVHGELNPDAKKTHCKQLNDKELAELRRMQSWLLAFSLEAFEE